MAKTAAKRTGPTKVKKPSARSSDGASKRVSKSERVAGSKCVSASKSAAPHVPKWTSKRPESLPAKADTSAKAAKPAGTTVARSRVATRSAATGTATLKPPAQQARADAKAVHGDIPPWTAAEIDEAFRRFQARDPHPKGELQHTNVFTLLVAVVLSAQATDAGVNKATPALFAAADTPAKMAALGEDAIREMIKSIGLFRTKAKNVAALAHILVETYHGEVPHTREELQALPGVGRKTANVVLNIAFGEPTMAVDTHIFRIGNRTGLAPGKNPLEVEHKLVERIPAKYMQHAHHWLILHGRYTCLARRPLCETCIIADLCKWPGKTVAA